MAANPQLVVRVAASLAELKKNLAESKNQIETTTQSMTKLATSFQGDKLIQQAHNVTAAIGQIGGVSKLTAGEQARVNTVVEKALQKYAALGKEAPEAMKRLAAETAKTSTQTGFFAKTFGTLGSQVKATMLGFVSAQAIIGAARMAWRSLTEFVGSSIQAFAAQELATKQLTAALIAQGTATPELVQHYQDLSAQFQRTTVYGDELVQEMMGLLVQLGDVMPDQMEGALKATTNLASGLGIDLKAATILVGKAFAGETGSLTRYGIVIDQAKLKAEGASAVLEAINQKFGGQAAAQVDTYSGQVAQLTNTWGDFQEVVGETITGILLPLIPALKSAAEWMQGFGVVVEKARFVFDAFLWAGLKAVKFLVDAQIHVLSLSNAFGIHNARIAELREVSVGLAGSIEGVVNVQEKAVKTTTFATDTMRAHAKAIGEADKATAAHQKAAQQLADTLGPVKLSGEVAKLNTALQILKGRGAISAETLSTVGDAAAVLFEKGATLTPELVALAVASEKLGLVLSKITKPGLDALPGVLEEVTQGTLNLYFQQQALSALLQQTTQDELEQFIGKLMKVGESYDIVNLHAKEFAKEKAPEVSASLDRMSAGFAQLAQIGGGALKGITGFAARLTGTLKQAVDGAKSFAAGWKQAGTGGAMNFISGLAGMIPGVGSIVGAVASLFGGLFSKSEGRKQLEAANAEIAKLKQQVIGLYGSTAEAEAIAARLGINFQNIWSNQNKAGLAFVQQQMDALAKALAAQSEAAKTLGDTFVQRLGVQARDATQAMLDKLASLGGLSADVQAELLAMAGPDFKAMEAAANRYGLSLDALGKGFWQAKLDEQFQIVVADFKLLTQTGADAGAVINAMGPKVASLVAQAIQYGTELPAGMRPIVDSMIQAGLLVDENGQKLKGLESLTFAETLTQGIDRVVEKLQELIDSLNRDVAGGFNNVIDAADRFGRTRIKIPVEWSVPPLPSSGGGGGFATGTDGFRDFGRGTLAMLHGREAIVPERDVSQREALAPTGTDGQAALTLGRIERMLRDQPRAIAVAVRDAVALGRR